MEDKLTYIVAVSGGVDSVVLLHKLKSKLQDEAPSIPSTNPQPPKYVVAHFDHGIREDSALDAEFVRELAAENQLDFELGVVKLGKDASEATARDARYEFLRMVMKKYYADKIITAHHQDDVIESMVINMIRGTGARGLNPMNGSTDILRPLIHKTKSDLISYAKEHGLTWREDSTNADDKYLRNYVRKNVMPILEPARNDLLAIQNSVDGIYHDLDMRLLTLLPKQNVLSRTWFVCLPYSVQKEIIRAWLVRCGVENLDKATIERITIACKTLPTGKQIDITGKLWLKSERQNILITSK
jgi:tRNA(Ile)-lysidine synthetase-like protein